MIENLQSINVFTPSIAEILLNLLVSLVCSYLVSLIYKYTYKGPGYSLSFANSIVFLSAITTLVIMIIGNNLARAFGLVGALSIIRFRTAIKDTSDIVYIFLSLTLGMAAGVGYYQLSFLGTLIIGAVLIIFSQTTNGIFSRNHYLLQFLYTGTKDSGSQPFVNVLEQYLSRYEVMNVRSDEINAAVVYSFFVKFKKNKEPDRLVDELRGVAGVRDINLFFDQQAV